MLEVAFTARDLAYTRFACSPLWEVIASVRVLKDPAASAIYRPWADPVRRQLATAGLDWRLLSDLVPVPTRTIPAFTCPPPATPVPSLDVELATLRAIPDAQVRDSLDRMSEPWSAALKALYDDPPAGLARLAALIEAYWTLAIDPYWPRIRALLEGDVLHRARRLAEGGAERLFDDLNPNVTWHDGRLSFAHRTVSGARSLRGRGLLLVPSAFVWPTIFSVTIPPWQPTLRYPPRGVATLWETRELDVPAALAGVLGRTRARLLTELDLPASTTALARRTGLTPGAVSQHLTALRAAGLTTAHRTGRFVLYARTAAAEALLASGAA